MSVYFTRILEGTEHVSENEQGALISPFPELIFKLIRTQIELADEHLKDLALCEVIRVATREGVKGRSASPPCRRTSITTSRCSQTSPIASCVC